MIEILLKYYLDQRGEKTNFSAYFFVKSEKISKYTLTNITFSFKKIKTYSFRKLRRFLILLMKSDFNKSLHKKYNDSKWFREIDNYKQI